MKKLKKIAVLGFVFAVQLVYAVDFETAFTAGNSVFKINGTFSKQPDFGFRLSLNEDLGKSINGMLVVERVPNFGNIIRGRVAYVTEYINISIGPTLGFLNTEPINRDFITLFQPGFGTGLSILTPKGFSASIDADFSIATVSVKQKGIYLQDGFFELGWHFPNLAASIRVSQKNKTRVEDSGDIMITQSDIGLYTTAHSKPSRIKIPLNVFYRGIRFEKDSTKRETGNVMVETGLIHTISSGFEWFLKFGASIYSFDIATKKQITDFFFDAEAGIKFSIGR